MKEADRMPVPQRIPLSLYRGDTCSVALRLWADTAGTEPVDLAGTLITAQVRLTPDASTVVATFEVTVSGNSVLLLLPPAVTAALPPKGVYDVQLDWNSDGELIQTVLAGDVSVTADVTRVV
jgi:hypothetical protein